MRFSKRRKGRFAATALPLAAALTLGGCGDVLEVVAPGVLTSEELEGPESVPLVVAGLTNDFAVMLEEYVLYSGLFTDEFILAGTFPTRVEVDERRVSSENGSVNGDLYEPLSTARFTADTAVVRFDAVLGDPDFGLNNPTEQERGAQQRRLQEGRAEALLRGGYARIYLAELFCQSAIRSEDPIGSVARMQDALAVLRDAEQAAADAGVDEVEAAAIVGQARALLWLATFEAGGVTWAEVAATAARVPEGFDRVVAERDPNTPSEYNEVYGQTWGDQFSLRWTVGAGTEPSRHFERFTYYDEWEDLGLIVTDAHLKGLTDRAFNSQIEVNLQMKYDERGDDIPFASQAEADMIQAEAELRQGNAAAANDLVNPHRDQWGLDDIDFTDPASFDLAELGLDPARSYTDLQIQLAVLLREKLRATWLEGTRQGDLRRMVHSPGIDLYPDKPGNEVCFPVPEQEITGQGI